MRISRVLYVPLLETNVRTAIIDRFLFDGNLHIADPDKADLVLNGDLIGIAQDDFAPGRKSKCPGIPYPDHCFFDLDGYGHRQGPLERTFFCRGDNVFSHRAPGHNRRAPR